MPATMLDSVLIISTQAYPLSSRRSPQCVGPCRQCSAGDFLAIAGFPDRSASECLCLHCCRRPLGTLHRLFLHPPSYPECLDSCVRLRRLRISYQLMRCQKSGSEETFC